MDRGGFCLSFSKLFQRNQLKTFWEIKELKKKNEIAGDLLNGWASLGSRRTPAAYKGSVFEMQTMVFYGYDF